MATELSTVTAMGMNRSQLETLSRDLLAPLREKLGSETRMDGEARYQVWTLPKADLPDAAKRKMLTNYSDLLKSCLRLADTDAKRRAITVARLFSTLASDKVDNRTAALRQEGWAIALAKRPALEVEIAAEMWLQGDHKADGEDRLFMPKPAHLQRLADIARGIVQFDIDTIASILKAEAAVGNQGYITKVE